MKTQTWKWIFVGAPLVTLGLFLGCQYGLAAVQPADGKDANGFSTDGPAAIDQNNPNQEPLQVVQPASVSLPAPAAEAVRLVQGGVQEEVILAYVNKGANSYRITEDQIVYLQDLGISQPVIKALIDHSQTRSAEAAAGVESGAGIDTVVSNGIAAPDAPAPGTEPNADPANPDAAPTFYQPLTPYGTWVDVASYGWCWQPTVLIVNPGWRPYCDGGRWLWTNNGWYWQSDYSWGWAPFHYGRWFQHPHRGWVWRPEREWGPSWVCWRNSPRYCGWAPLPPGARFSAGVGWTFNGAAVSADFGFGLRSSHFTFVTPGHLVDRTVSDHAMPRHEADVVFNNTTVINRYRLGPNHTIVNQGVDRSRIEAVTHVPIREVNVHELPLNANRSMLPDRIDKGDKVAVIYRPGPQITVPRNPHLPAFRREAVSLPPPRPVFTKQAEAVPGTGTGIRGAPPVAPVARPPSRPAGPPSRNQDNPRPKKSTGSD